jgi:hypothetical protein
MALSVTAEALISSAQRRAFMASTSGAISAADWLAILNEQLFGYVVPYVTKRRKGYWLAHTDVPLVSGQAAYVIPSRAAGARFYAVQLLDAQGEPATPMLTPLEPQEAQAWPQSALSAGQPYAYSVVGNNVTLSPPPRSPLGTPTMRVHYYKRPSTLVLSDDVQVVTGYTQESATTFRISSNASPSLFAVGQRVELVRGVPAFETDGPYTVVSVDDDPGSADVAGTIPVTAQAGNPSIGRAGDTLCLEDTANVVTNMPSDWGPWLAQAAAVEALSDRGDDAKFARADARLRTLEAMVDSQLSQRDVAAVKKMTNGRAWGIRRAPFYVP